MVSLEQSQINSLLLILLLLVVGCVPESSSSGEAIPPEWVSQDNSGWVESQGILFWEGAPYSGWKYAMGKSGDTLFLGGFVNGHAEGQHTWRYPDGQLQEVRQFSAGRQSGRCERWYEHGQKAFEANFIQDHYEGQVRSWYENGQPHEQFQYSNGRENGRQQRWDEQRNVLANYEVRNGRKYGLSGTKNCVSSMVVDSAGMDGR